MTAPDVRRAPDLRGRECDCPAWVAQCAHFDGRRVILKEPSETGEAPCLGHCTGVERFAVAVGTTFVPCPSKPGCQQVKAGPDFQPRFFDNKPAAAAAFEAAAERLRAGAL